jgi:hypothetical protein
LIDSDATSSGHIFEDSDEFDLVYSAAPFAPFSSEILSFLQALSVELLSTPESRTFPDIATFAFWCRKSSLMKMKVDFESRESRVGRGNIFHVAPGNVPINFAYSLAAGLLSGNSNVVKLPSQESIQISVVCSTIDRLLVSEDHKALKNHIRLIRYDRTNTKVTSKLSSLCDVRVIWGGDDTISSIRESQIGARAFDVTFADRYSICMIDAYEYLDNTEPHKLAKDFFNDTYLFDQNACTAPHLIVWRGSEEKITEAKEKFWADVHTLVKSSYEFQAVSSIDKLSAAYRYLAQNTNGTFVQGLDNLVSRLDVTDPLPGLDEWKASCGLFFEVNVESITEVAHLITRRYQTVSYFGIDPSEIMGMIIDKGLFGIDRIVRIGRTLDFSLYWDGFDLVKTLSRVISIS